ncbi:NTP transferase domain-containing protein [Actinopolymorpha sp. NPDC004070]|uniref:NTP transferase domain-containing protein n=1 Tax=Actinopolymorpha sp. NPDC004070 TaxID=3154548 RepID=UPI0033A878F0
MTTPTPPTSGVPGGPAYDAIVLAGGGARRFGGTDKVLLPVGGRPMLDRVLAACAGAASVTVVGPRRPVDPHLPVRTHWTREDPPGSGPLAAVAAGLGAGATPVVVVLAADMPLVDADVVADLVAALAGVGPDVEAVTLTDETGRTQPLAAAYRRTAVDRVLAETGDPRNQPARRLTTRLKCAELRSPLAARDCDTPDDLAVADRLARTSPDGTHSTHSTERPPMLLDWARQLTTALATDATEPSQTSGAGVSQVVDSDLIDTILDLARDAAHNVDRPAAPLTTFLVGYAAARRGGSPDDLAACVDLARALALRWDTGDGSTDPSGPGSAETGSAD